MSLVKRILRALIFSSAGIGAPLNAITQEAHQSPPWNQADALHGADVMAEARQRVLAEGGDQKHFYVMFNQLEAQFAEAEDRFAWNGQAWYGGDLNKLWVKSEGHASLTDGGVEEAEIEPGIVRDQGRIADELQQPVDPGGEHRIEGVRRRLVEPTHRPRGGHVGDDQQRSRPPDARHPKAAGAKAVQAGSVPGHGLRCAPAGVRPLRPPA